MVRAHHYEPELELDRIDAYLYISWSIFHCIWQLWAVPSMVYLATLFDCNQDIGGLVIFMIFWYTLMAFTFSFDIIGSVLIFWYFAICCVGSV